MDGNERGSFLLEDHGSLRWHHDPEHGPSDRVMQHGHRGHHGHGGHRGHGRHGLHSGRKLSAPDLQLLLLALLANKPAHGYELIKLLEDHSHGLYIPSPGMIYPALTYLEEIGFTSVETEGAKKRYSLTEAGRDYYEQSRDAASRILSDMERIGAEMERARQALESGVVPEDSEHTTSSEGLEVARRELRKVLREREPFTAEEAQRVAEILDRAAAEIRRGPQLKALEEFN